MNLVSGIIPAIFFLTTATFAQNCWHIVNKQTGQYLQPASFPTPDDQQHAWLSYNRTDSALWNLIATQGGNFYIKNRKTKLFLTLLPNEDVAYLRAMGQSNSAKAIPAQRFLFRLHDKPGEMINTVGKSSLYAVSCAGGMDGKVRATARCGLPQCQWRFEGYTCE